MTAGDRDVERAHDVVLTADISRIRCAFAFQLDAGRIFEDDGLQRISKLPRWIWALAFIAGTVNGVMYICCICGPEPKNEPI